MLFLEVYNYAIVCFVKDLTIDNTSLCCKTNTSEIAWSNQHIYELSSNSAVYLRDIYDIFCVLAGDWYMVYGQIESNSTRGIFTLKGSNLKGYPR